MLVSLPRVTRPPAYSVPRAASALRRRREDSRGQAGNVRGGHFRVQEQYAATIEPRGKVRRGPGGVEIEGSFLESSFATRSGSRRLVVPEHEKALPSQAAPRS